MKTVFVPALRLLGILTLLTGVVYPSLTTLVARLAFPLRARGTLVEHNGKVVGSALLGQRFTNAVWFWPRPSAANFETVPSAASNLGPTAGALTAAVRRRAAVFRAAHGPGMEVTIPPEMLFASGSGLDPHISPEAARLQIPRVARARRFSAEQERQLAALVERCVEPPQFGFLGEPRVNILLLNLALDRLR